MTNQGKEILKNAYEISDMYFRFLNLGYFFDTYAKKHYLANRVPLNIDIQLEHGSGYKLEGIFIEGMLQDIYNKPQAMSVFSYLALFNALRGIAGAMREAFGDAKRGASLSPEHKEMRALFALDFFNGDEAKFEEFDGIIRLIRNVLSHNITDRVVLQEKDFEDQKNHWLKHKPRRDMCFIYSYGQAGATMKKAGYDAACDICIKWGSVNQGVLFVELVSTFQCFMLVEFCRNALCFLNEKYK